MNELLLFENLLASLGDAFAEEGRPGGDLAADALRTADTSFYRRTVSEEAPRNVLESTIALPDSLPLAEMVVRCQKMLDWTSWTGEGLENNVSRRLFTTELVGPDGHIPAEGVRVGLLASEPWTDYPVSSHSGEETYLVLSGVAEWSVEPFGYKEQHPGSFVHHPAWVKHGRRTKTQPFLGAWRWSGDLDLSTFSVA